MIIKGMTNDEYHAHPALGSTTAKLGLKSMRLLKDKLDGLLVEPDKPAFQIGRLVHMMCLEPERFGQCVIGGGPLNPKSGKPYGRETQAFQEWQAANPQITVVEPWVRTMLERCPEDVVKLFTEEGGESEVSVFHGFPQLDITVKCRPDRLNGTTIVDLKTCQDVDAMEREITKRSYWFSDAWYRMVMKAVTDRPHRFRFVFAEKKPPYRWRIVDLDADYAMWADDQVDALLARISEAQQTDDWSDDEELYQMVSRPDYLDDTDDEGDDQ